MASQQSPDGSSEDSPARRGLVWLGRLLTTEDAAKPILLTAALAELAGAAGACRAAVLALQEPSGGSREHARPHPLAEWRAPAAAGPTGQGDATAPGQATPDPGPGGPATFPALEVLPDGGLRMVLPCRLAGGASGAVWLDWPPGQAAADQACLGALAEVLPVLAAALPLAVAVPVAAAVQEGAARAEREGLAAAIQTLPDPVALFDAEERLIFANDHYIALHPALGPHLRPGRSLEEILRARLADDPPPEAAGRAEDWIAQELAAYRNAPRMIEARGPCGRWFRNLDLPTAAGGRMVLRIDITRTRQAQTELLRLAAEASRARELLEAAVEVLPDAFVVFDRDDRLVLCNDRYREIYPRCAHLMTPGTRFEEILRTSALSGEVVDAVGREEEWLVERLSSHRRVHSDFEQQLVDGRWLRIIERSTPEGQRVGMRIDITDLKRAEERLAGIIEGAEVATWDWDAGVGASVINHRYAELLGYRHEDLSPLNSTRFAQLVHPADRTRVAAAVERVMAGPDSLYVEELRLRHNAGHWVWVQARGRATRRGPDGRAMNFAGVFLDITARKQLEESLAAERDFLARLMATSVAGIVALDGEGHVVFANREAEDILGIPPGAPVPFDLDSIGWRRERLDGGPLELEHLAFRRVLATGREVRDLRYALVWPDGRRRALSLNAAPVSHAGSPARAVVSVADITEQLATEAALRAALDEQAQAVARFHEVSAVGRSWAWEQNADLRFTYQSESIRDLIGIDIATTIGRTREELYCWRPEVRASADWAGLEARLAAREPFSDFVFRIFGNDGQEYYLELAGRPMFDGTGRFTGYRGAGRDVTALIRARIAAEAASRIKSEFLATMSHEIRTPLNGVLGMAELLEETVETPEQREMVSAIRASGEGLLTIINDILDMSKIEAGKMTLESVAFDPADLARRTLALHLPRAQEKGIALTHAVSPTAPVARLGDPHRLGQILHNLLSNAIRFTEAGGVTLRVHAPPEEVLRIAVEDTGIGMSADQLARLFTPFEQAETSTTRRFGGTGLGSAIVKQLAELMGGSVSVDSRPGSGTRVVVDLPLPHAADVSACKAAKAVTTPPAAQVTPAPAPLRGLRLMVADDNATNRRLLELMLVRAGAAVTLTVDGRAALEAWAPGRFDALLLDISMPEMDGIAALAAIRARAADAGTEPTPALAITANAMTHQIADYLAAGFDGHVGKPFSRELLLSEVMRIVAPPGVASPAATAGAATRMTGEAERRAPRTG